MVKLAERISYSNSDVEDFCRRWGVSELSVFGSVLRDDFREDSDVDLLVDFAPAARHTIFHVIEMEEELKKLFGRNVDLVEKRAIARSDNYLRRRQILGTAQVIYDVG